MINQISNLTLMLGQVQREQQYQGLKRYVHKLKGKKPLNGKEKFVLKGATAYLKRVQADRRAMSLGLVEFVPYYERGKRPSKVSAQSDFRAWDLTVGLFHQR